MNKDAKRISNNLRTQISITKSHILHSKNYFYGAGYVFKTAIKELRDEGIKIIYNRSKDGYILE